jgi:hypothetical protein
LTGGTVEVVQDTEGITVTVSEESRQEIDTIVVLELDRPAGGISPVEMSSMSPDHSTKLE